MTQIMICANNIDELGGAQRVVHLLADGFHRRGHEVTAVGVTPYEPAHPMPGGFDRRVLMPDVWPKKSAQTERIRANLRATAVSQLVELLRTNGHEPGVIITAQVWSMEILADALAVEPCGTRSLEGHRPVPRFLRGSGQWPRPRPGAALLPGRLHLHGPQR